MGSQYTDRQMIMLIIVCLKSCCLFVYIFDDCECFPLQIIPAGVVTVNRIKIRRKIILYLPTENAINCWSKRRL